MLRISCGKSYLHSMFSFVDNGVMRSVSSSIAFQPSGSFGGNGSSGLKEQLRRGPFWNRGKRGGCGGGEILGSSGDFVGEAFADSRGWGQFLRGMRTPFPSTPF